MPDPLPDPDASPTPPRRKLTCEFCLCELAPSGDYFTLSDRAKALRGLEETNERLSAQIQAAQEQTTQAIRERDEARAALTAATTGPTREPFLTIR